MLKNFLTMAFRQARRRPGHTLLNAAGLAIGMASCILIGLYVLDELSFDRFHENVDRLFVVVGRHDAALGSLAAEYSVATVLQNGIAEVERTVRVWGGEPSPVIREETRLRSNERVLLVEPQFFELFSFPAVTGDPARVLAAPDGAVITRSMARKFFGADDPIGRPLTFYRFGNNVHTVIVQAVVADPPAHSSFQFDLVAPLSLLGTDVLREGQWGFSLFETYLLTSRPMSAGALSDAIARAMADIDIETRYEALALPDLHLSGLQVNGLHGRLPTLYLFGSIALLILLIAAVNYVNFVTAQSMQRAREVGVRKSLGAARSQLARQFLGESILTTAVALVAALVLAAAALPGFNSLFDKQLAMTGGGFGWALPGVAAIVLLVAIAAGIYPAFVLARYRPADVLRGRGGGPSGGRNLRRTLVVSQFAISAGLIIGTLIIHQQLNYVQESDLGFDHEDIVIVDLPRELDAAARQALKEQVQAHHGVVRASIATAVPGLFNMGYRKAVSEAAPQARTSEESIRFRPAAVDADYLAMLGIPLIAGRNISDAVAPGRAYVLNRVSAARLGWTPEEAVGKTFSLGPPGTPEGEVIGVVENFHISSMHEAIEPVVLLTNDVGLPYALTARLAPTQESEAVAFVESRFRELAPDAAFQYHFLNDVFEGMYRAEEQLRRIMAAFMALAVFIACLGLVGLAAFTAEQRTKEIGIRKVLGASVADVVGLLSRDFLLLVAIAFVIAAPLAYLAMSRWLESFAYRIEVGPSIFLLVGAALAAATLLSVSYQAVTAALRDPVRSLRYE